MTPLNTFRRCLPVVKGLRPPAASSAIDAPCVKFANVERHEFPRIEVRFGQRIECLSGCVWITSDGDIKDVVISAGEQWIADLNARVMVTALEPARIAHVH